MLARGSGLCENIINDIDPAGILREGSMPHWSTNANKGLYSFVTNQSVKVARFGGIPK